LVAEAGVDRHDQDLIQVLQDLFQCRRRGRRVDDHANALAECLDPLHGAVQVVVGFPVHQQGIRAGRDEFVQEQVGARHHQVRLQGQLGQRPERRDDGRPHREVRHEVPIHDIDVDPISPSPRGLGDLLAQAGKIGREDGRGQFHSAFVHRRRLSFHDSWQDLPNARVLACRPFLPVMPPWLPRLGVM
jgi:hypothetical protein